MMYSTNQLIVTLHEVVIRKLKLNVKHYQFMMSQTKRRKLYVNYISSRVIFGNIFPKTIYFCYLYVVMLSNCNYVVEHS